MAVEGGLGVSLLLHSKVFWGGNGKHLSWVRRMEDEKPGAVRAYWQVGEDKAVAEK